MFTVRQRDALCDRVLELGHDDERVVAGASVGSLAVNEGDRFSDLDLTFAVADEAAVQGVLADWTRTLAGELGAVRLADLERGPTVYRVLLLPQALQLNLSMAPASQFRPAGPRFRLLFGDGLHARACIERGRVWQAEHYIGAVRDHALSLACLRRGLPAVQARGYDDLPAEFLGRFERTHVGGLSPDSLRNALTASMSMLVHEGTDAGLPHAGVVAERIEGLC